MPQGDSVGRLWDKGEIVVARAALGKELLKQSPVDALAFMRENPAIGGSFREAVSEAYGMLALNDWEKCMELLKNEPAAMRLAAISGGKFLDVLAKQDPAKMIELISEVPMTAATRDAYMHAGRALAQSHPEQAVNWLKSLPDAPVSQEISTLVFANLQVNHGAETAIGYSRLLSGEAKDSAVRTVIGHLAKSDVEKALQISGSMEPAIQQELYREISRSAAYHDTVNAIKIIEDPALSQKIGSDFRSEFINHTVQNWAKSNQDEAIDWVESLPDADKSKGIQGVVATWMKADPIAASEWLSQQPPGPARDAGAQEIINQIKDTDPERAEEWRQSMTPK